MERIESRGLAAVASEKGRSERVGASWPLLLTVGRRGLADVGLGPEAVTRASRVMCEGDDWARWRRGRSAEAAGPRGGNGNWSAAEARDAEASAAAGSAGVTDLL